MASGRTGDDGEATLVVAVVVDRMPSARLVGCLTGRIFVVVERKR